MTLIRCPNCGHCVPVNDAIGYVKCSNVKCRGTIKYNTDKGEQKFIPRQKHTAMKDRTTSSGVIFSR